MGCGFPSGDSPSPSRIARRIASAMRRRAATDKRAGLTSRMITSRCSQTVQCNRRSWLAKRRLLEQIALWQRTAMRSAQLNLRSNEADVNCADCSQSSVKINTTARYSDFSNFVVPSTRPRYRRIPSQSLSRHFRSNNLARYIRTEKFVAEICNWSATSLTGWSVRRRSKNTSASATGNSPTHR